MAWLGYQAMYRLLNGSDEWVAERAFLPDDVAAARTARTPLATYESETPLSEHSVIAFSVAYELELTSLFDCLSLAGLPILAPGGAAPHPLIGARRPLPLSHPLPLRA